MPKTMRHVLKADEVAFNGSLRLSMGQRATAGCKGLHSTADAASVRIAESHPEYAVIEVTCPCGRTMHVRCDYAAKPPLVPEDSART